MISTTAASLLKTFPGNEFMLGALDYLAYYPSLVSKPYFDMRIRKRDVQ